jgi:hypothetical protein
MTNDNIKELRSKIIQGIELAYNRLLISKQKEDGDLVISRNGQIISIKAKELLK